MENTQDLEKALEVIKEYIPALLQLDHEDDRWVGVVGCARRLGISKKTLQKKVSAWNKGKIDIAAPIGTDIMPYHPKGCDWRFEKKEIARYILKNKVN